MRLTTCNGSEKPLRRKGSRPIISILVSSSPLELVDHGGKTSALYGIADMREAGFEVALDRFNLPLRSAFGNDIINKLFGLVGVARVEGGREQGRAQPFVRHCAPFRPFTGGDDQP